MLWWPLTNTVRRRLRALAIALGVHVLFGVVAYFAQNEYFENLPEIPDSVDVVFLTAPEPVLSPPPEPEPLPQISPPEPAVAPPPPSDTPAVPDTILPAAGTAVETDDEDEENAATISNSQRLAAYEVQPINIGPPPGSTARFLQDIFCATTPDATREAADCDRTDYDVTALLRSTGTHDPEALNAAFGLDLTPEQIRAMFGVTRHELSGQPTLDTTNRPTSSSDQMRDTLPPQVVDPSFGD